MRIIAFPRNPSSALSEYLMKILEGCHPHRFLARLPMPFDDGSRTIHRRKKRCLGYFFPCLLACVLPTPALCAQGPESPGHERPYFFPAGERVRIRTLIHQADPEVIEEVKWRKPSNPLGVPVWSHAGIICTGETYKNYVKLTFAKGASLPDPSGLFNSSLEGNTRRAIDFHEDDTIDETAFKALIRAAVALNQSA